jgi:hypothetical protein
MSTIAGVITLLDDEDDETGEADAASIRVPSFFFSSFSAIYVLLLFENIIFEIA